jgi:hypothetical protein
MRSEIIRKQMKEHTQEWATRKEHIKKREIEKRRVKAEKAGYKKK